MALFKASSIEVGIYRDIKRSHLAFRINFKLKSVFFPLLFFTTHTPNNLHFIRYQENNVQSPIRTYPIIELHEHKAILYVLELYSANQIPFCHIGLRSITCHFLVNNLRVITYSKRIIQPH